MFISILRTEINIHKKELLVIKILLFKKKLLVIYKENQEMFASTGSP
jgi:hypothetical protein